MVPSAVLSFDFSPAAFRHSPTMTRHSIFRSPALTASAIVVAGLASVSPSWAAAPATSDVAKRADAPVRILSAYWDANSGGTCPTGGTGLDILPVTFSAFIRPMSFDAADFTITRDDGTTTHPTCTLMYPPDERNEHQAINMMGDFGDLRWYDVPAGLTRAINQLEEGPYIADAWMLTPRLLIGDKNACTVGKNSVRVTWANGMTAYPLGREVDAAVVNSYRAVFTLPNGKPVIVKPLAVGDLLDHRVPANDDNMHDLCLPALPAGATLSEVRIGASYLQDPNGGPNPVQHFKVRSRSSSRNGFARST